MRGPAALHPGDTFSMSYLSLVGMQSSVDWVAMDVAIGSLLVSAISILVTVTLWRRTGWVLEVEPKKHEEDGWVIYITNTGRQTCEVASAAVAIWAGERLVKEVWAPKVDDSPVATIAASGRRKLKDLEAAVEEAVDSAPQDAKIVDVRAFAWTGGRRYDSKPRQQKQIDLTSRRPHPEIHGRG